MVDFSIAKCRYICHMPSMDAMGYVEFYMEKVMFHIAEMLRTQPIWLVVSTPLKNISQIGSFPQIGVKMKNIGNHHPAMDLDSFCLNGVALGGMGRYAP